ncbi:MAG: isoamylase early set domain-containing protein [Spirochaetales bacterium]|nr:isoamylase early set domain-containing protein [Spirochaetales bacterium]
MALVKKNLKTGNVCNVTFSLPSQAVNGAKEVCIAGDFNKWSTKDPAYKLKKKADGSFFITLKLEQGREYQFRYLINKKQWENDWMADKYVPAPTSLEENSVVVT